MKLSFIILVVWSVSLVCGDPREIQIDASTINSFQITSNSFLQEGTKWIIRGPPGKNIAFNFIVDQRVSYWTQQQLWNYLNPSTWQYQSQYQSGNTPGYFRIFNGDTFGDDFIEVTSE